MPKDNVGKLDDHAKYAKVMLDVHKYMDVVRQSREEAVAAAARALEAAKKAQKAAKGSDLSKSAALCVADLEEKSDLLSQSGPIENFMGQLDASK